MDNCAAIAAAATAAASHLQLQLFSVFDDHGTDHGGGGDDGNNGGDGGEVSVTHCLYKVGKSVRVTMLNDIGRRVVFHRRDKQHADLLEKKRSQQLNSVSVPFQLYTSDSYRFDLFDTPHHHPHHHHHLHSAMKSVRR